MLNLTGTNSGDQTITLTGDVTGTGTGSFATTIAANTVTFAKMATLSANSIIGNNTGATATPSALSTTQVKTLLSLNNVENTALSTWAGSTNLTTIGALTSLSVSGITLSSSGITSTGTIAITPNGGASPVEIWAPLSMKTNGITNVGSINTFAIPTSAFVGINDFQTITNKTINASQLVDGSVTLAKLATLGSLTVNSGSTDATFTMNGTTITGTRYLSFQQNGTQKVTSGIVGSNYYFVYDSAFASDMFRLVLGGGQCVRFPTYSTLSSLSIGASGLLTGTSDRRLKQNEEVLSPSTSLQQVLNLQPKTYVWKDDKDRTRIGFIAQDVETVIPDAIDGKKYEYEFVRDGASQDSDGTVRIDEEGNPVLDYEKPRYRGLDQCAIIAVLVSAVQELTNRVIELESKFGETLQE
jgi:hypothetical protein